MKSASRSRKNALLMSTKRQSSSEEPERPPRKGDKTGQGPRTTRNYACGVQRNNSGEREDLALQNKKALRAELQPLKAECQKWSKLVAGANCTMYVSATF